MSTATAKKSMKSTGLTAFDSTSVNSILAEAEAVLRPIAEKYGLTLDRKGRSYHKDALPVMFQFLIKQTAADGSVMTSEAKDFVKYAIEFGFAPTDLGREFQSRGETFRIAGMLPRSHKFPVLVENVRTGKQFKFPDAAVLKALGGNGVAAVGARGDDAKFTAGHREKNESLKAWLEARKGHTFTAGWKEEMVTRGGGTVGPLVVCDETEQDADPEVTKEKGRHGAEIIGIPFGAPYLGETEWMTQAEAKKLAKRLGLHFKGEG